MLVSGKFLAGHVSFICRKDGIRLMDEHAMPSGLAELKQLCVEANSEHQHLLQLHTLQATKSWVGPGMRLGYE